MLGLRARQAALVLAVAALATTVGAAPARPVSAATTRAVGATAPAAAAAAAPTPVELPGIGVRTFAVGFAWAAAFAVDGAGNLYLPTGTAGAALTKVAPDGTTLAVWAGRNVVSGQPDTIAGVAIDPATGDVWVSDASADRIVRLGPDLRPKSSFGRTGLGAGQFSSPGGLALLPNGTIAVADMGGDRVEVFRRDGRFVRQFRAPGGRIAPYDVTADGRGNLWISGSQPTMFGVVAGMVTELSPRGSVLRTVTDVPYGKLWYPSVAIRGDTVYVADAWWGLLTLGADGSLGNPVAIPGGGTSAATVRVAPDGSIYTLACFYASSDCTITRMLADGTQTAMWHASAGLAHPGRIVQANGHGMYLQCVGSGSPTIVWEAGGSEPGWMTTAQYLQGRVGRISRFCVYDRQGLGFSESAGYPEGDRWLETAGDLRALLREAGVPGPYIIAGHSYGGLLARIFAYQNPRDVVGVLAVDPSSEAEFNGPVPMPFAPFDIVTCTDASCPLYDDINGVLALEHGQITGSLGSVPLIVMGHDPSDPFFPGEYDAYWLSLGRKTATASSNSVYVTPSWSGHIVPLAQPALVVAALQGLVDAARSPSHRLPACSAFLRSAGGVCG